MLVTGVFVYRKVASKRHRSPRLLTSRRSAVASSSRLKPHEAECERVSPSFGGSRKHAGENCGFPSTKAAGDGACGAAWRTGRARRPISDLLQEASGQYRRRNNRSFCSAERDF
ncbi:hypothetical protein AVEN_159869-1 [Araneus ventricosus]|uniref:Uncharacterized protein n=1 Tax=Araneus ventricosus TaxID=182803 RepID=A0A4Y2E5N6_ARAVE|nr:hypothetical protein AVEN_159869-1 [Araneus ventricosus]